MSEEAVSNSYQLASLFLASHFRIRNMKNMKQLNVQQNSIKQIPVWIGSLTSLSFLDFSKNSIGALPDGIGKLVALTHLDISENTPLMRLTSSITSLDLWIFKCENCYNLIEPPYAVCQGGFSEIKQYYNDLDDGKDTMTLATVALIGRKEAGKSTLLRSMKNGFTAFQSGDENASKTKVFEVHNIFLQEKQCVNVIDFGGDEVYHYAYQLTFRKDCIPIVVVNMEEYENLSKKFGRREATR